MSTAHDLTLLGPTGVLARPGSLTGQPFPAIPARRAAQAALAELFVRASRRVRALARLALRRRRHRAELRALAELDHATLRDIGVDPSEVTSVAAELAGRVAAARRRTELDFFLSASSRLRVRQVDVYL